MDNRKLKELLRENRESLIEIVDRTRNSMGLSHVLKCFGLSKTTYYLWIQGTYSKCSSSLLEWCLVRQPHQLAKFEIERMRDILLDKLYLHWPVSSLAFQAQRTGTIHASLSSWYKYMKLMGIKRTRATYKKKKFNKYQCLK